MKIVHFNRSIFTEETIKTAMNVYKNHAFTTVKYNSDYAVVTFWNCKYDEEQTIKEFENYMIGIENT